MHRVVSKWDLQVPRVEDTLSPHLWTAVVMDDDSPVRNPNRWSKSICSSHVPKRMNSSVPFYGKQ